MTNWITDPHRSTTTHEATTKQVGGDHYKDQGIQPLELTYLNFGYAGVKASLYTKVNKYLTRNKANEGEDIRKAIHCLEMLESFKLRSITETKS
tara:strand:- start:79 stop:360 length:282 start_codon:yes stop_codon:yes gene_type:complete